MSRKGSCLNPISSKTGNWWWPQTYQSSRRAWMLLGTWWDFWDCPVEGQKLDSMVLVSTFQLRLFYDFMKARYRTCDWMVIQHGSKKWNIRVSVQQGGITWEDYGYLTQREWQDTGWTGILTKGQTLLCAHCTESWCLQSRDVNKSLSLLWQIILLKCYMHLTKLKPQT